MDPCKAYTTESRECNEFTKEYYINDLLTFMMEHSWLRTQRTEWNRMELFLTKNTKNGTE